MLHTQPLLSLQHSLLKWTSQLQRNMVWSSPPCTGTKSTGDSSTTGWRPTTVLEPLFTVAPEGRPFPTCATCIFYTTCAPGSHLSAGWGFDASRILNDEIDLWKIHWRHLQRLCLSVKLRQCESGTSTTEFSHQPEKMAHTQSGHRPLGFLSPEPVGRRKVYYGLCRHAKE